MVVSESAEIAYKNRNELRESFFILSLFKCPRHSKLQIRGGPQGKKRGPDASTSFRILRSYVTLSWRFEYGFLIS